VKRIGIILAGAVAGLLIAGFLPGPLTLIAGLAGIIIGLLLGMIVSSILIARARGEDPEKVAKELVRQVMRPDPGAEERPVHEQTIQTNQTLRMDPQLPAAVLSAFEMLIDRIRNVVPKALDRSPDSEMTFDLVELGKSHLQNLAQRFLALSIADRQGTQPELLLQLQELTETVDKAGRALDEGRVFDFEAQRDFLKAKFGAQTPR
jgi:hypothetical protein